MHKLALLLAVSGWISTSVSGQTASQSALDKSAIESYVRHLFIWGPQIAIQVGDPKPSSTLPGFRDLVVTASAGQATKELKFLLSADGKKILQGNVYDLAKNPFEADLSRLRTDGQPSFGPPDAPVSVVMFSDFQCSFCKEEAQSVRKNIPAAFPKDVKVFFKDFPLDSIHPWARPAAIAGRCIYRQKPAAFWDFHDWIFANQDSVNAENLKSRTLEFAKTKGIEPIQLTSCIDSKATEAEVTRNVTEGRALDISSTPTLFVNGRKLEGEAPWGQLKQILEHEIEYAKKHAEAEKCCEVKLPSPLNK